MTKDNQSWRNRDSDPPIPSHAPPARRIPGRHLLPNDGKPPNTNENPRATAARITGLTVTDGVATAASIEDAVTEIDVEECP